MTDLTELAKQIIEKNQYLALATSGLEGTSWSCILAYSYDADFNFYFVSLPTSKHSKMIEKDNNVSLVIYDSTQGFGVGAGLQIEATVNELSGEETDTAEKIYFGRNYPYGNMANEFTEGLRKLIKNGVYRFYKITPTHIWINDVNADTDIRVEVNL